MSQRLGPADGRAFSIATSSKLFNNYIMEANGIPLVDNYAYRQMLMKKGPAVVQSVQRLQVSHAKTNPNGVNQCYSSHLPLLKVPGIY
tara:strand:- start:465 stop:728 length:264 start_codon:yes stop_codon:yes gene_type:complete